MKQRSTSVTRAVLTFALSGLAVLVLVGIGGVLVLQRVGTAEAIREAQQITEVVGRGIVEPSLRDGLLTGDADALLELDILVIDSVLKDPIVRVKIWTPSGRIVYSDEPELIGAVYALGDEEIVTLRTDQVTAEVSDLSEPENRLERQYGSLLEVYMPISTPNGDELLFEAYLRFGSVAASGQRLWRAFAPVLGVALAALALLQIPLAWSMARRVRQAQRERERLLQRAIDASDLERRRIAGDLHDGPVQQLAGLSMSLSAQADRLADAAPQATSALREAAAGTRQGMRALRSSIVGIYPPNLRTAGLSTVVSDLVAPLGQYGIVVDVDVPPDLRVPPEIETLLFRASQEAIRNIVTHADARHVRIRVSHSSGRAKLEIDDDGSGFSPDQQADARSNGHVGLDLMSDLARDAGGSLEIASEPGRGTRLRMEVPAP